MYSETADKYVPTDIISLENEPITHYRFIKPLDIEKATNLISPFSSRALQKEEDFYPENFQPQEEGYYLALAPNLDDEYLESIMLDHLEQTDQDFYPPLSTYFTEFIVQPQTHRQLLKRFVEDRKSYHHLMVIKRDVIYILPETTVEIEGEVVQPAMEPKYKDTIIGFTSFKPVMELKHPETKEIMKCFVIRTTSILPNHRNLGIAKRLYHHIEYVLAPQYKNKGVTAIARRTWSTNETQQHLYHKTGFELWYKEEHGRSFGVHNLYFKKDI